MAVVLGGALSELRLALLEEEATLGLLAIIHGNGSTDVLEERAMPEGFAVDSGAAIRVRSRDARRAAEGAATFGLTGILGVPAV